MKYQRLKEEAKLYYEDIRSGRIPLILVGAASCGIAVGALDVISTIDNVCQKYAIDARIIKVGCLGLCFAEPLVCIIKEDNPSICYKNITPELATKLIYNYFLQEDPCLELALGTLEVEDDNSFIPELERENLETKIILRSCGWINPEEIRDYIALSGYEALDKALKMKPEEIIEEIKGSGLRGLGGAGFPTGLKWERCYHASLETKDKKETKYVICNADEGDPGAFMDRVILESSPHQVIEGMVIAGYAIGSNQGFIYIRHEYPLARERFNIALDQAKENNLLGKNILESGFDFEIEVFVGMGAFVCGESTALMYSIEGRRPMPRVRPPHSVEHGLWQKPTLLQNVKTFSCIPQIIRRGKEWFSNIGTENSKGTTVFALAGKVKNSGLVEVKMGTTLKEVIYKLGGGLKDNKKLKAIQIGGPSGGCIPERFMETPVDFDSLKAVGSMLGSGGLIVLDEDTCMVDVAKYFLSFTQDESCGKCTFCRIGTKQILLILEEITKGEAKLEDLELLLELAESIKEGALCGLGKTAPNPVLTTLRYFREEYIAHIIEKRCPAKICKDLISYYIIKERCYRECEHCLLRCPSEAIKEDEKRIKFIDQEKCVKCGICQEVCPKEYDAVVKLSPKIDERDNISS